MTDKQAKMKPGIPLEGFQVEVARAAAASIGTLDDKKGKFQIDVDIDTDPDGRPITATFGPDGCWEIDTDKPVHMVMVDAMRKNGLIHKSTEHAGARTWFTCGFDGDWFGTRRPGTGRRLWHAMGFESPDFMTRPGDKAGRGHFIARGKARSNPLAFFGPSAGWCIFRGSDERLAMMPGCDRPGHAARNTALAILGMLPEECGDGLIYDRLSDAVSMLDTIKMAGSEFLDRLEYGPQRSGHYFCGGGSWSRDTARVDVP